MADGRGLDNNGVLTVDGHGVGATGRIPVGVAKCVVEQPTVGCPLLDHDEVGAVRIDTDFNIPRFLDIPDSWIYA